MSHQQALAPVNTVQLADTLTVLSQMLSHLLHKDAILSI